NTTIHQRLGSEKHYNVFIGEVTAVQLAVEILRDDHDFRICYIYSDSQAAIKAIDKPRRQSGQQIIKELLDCIDEVTLQHPQLRIILIWISGHIGIEGNERADTEAKR